MTLVKKGENNMEILKAISIHRARFSILNWGRSFIWLLFHEKVFEMYKKASNLPSL